MQKQYAPYIRTSDSTSGIMMDVCIALIPAAVFGVYVYGICALLVIILSVCSCVASEMLWQLLMHREVTVSDGSAAVTGLLLALTLPPKTEWWIPVSGGTFAIIIVKQLYGGLGKNIMNPALAARCFLLISFARQMTEYRLPFVDAVSAATPLAAAGMGENIDIVRLFAGLVPGCIGEVSVPALLIGAVYLIYKKVITLLIPVTYITSFLMYIVLYSLLNGICINMGQIGVQLFGGGLILAAFFMLPDYVTSPVSPAGRIIYSVAAGILTGVLRCQGSSAEGVSFAILCANMLVPLIDKISNYLESTIPVRREI